MSLGILSNLSYFLNMAKGNSVSLELIGKQLERLHEDMKAVKDRLERIEKGQDRFRVRIALLEAHQKDMTGDLAAIARIIEAAGVIKKKR